MVVQVTQEILDYMRLSARVYDTWGESDQLGSSNPNLIGVDGWKRVGLVPNSDSGFYGEVFRSDAGTEVIISFRGNDQWRDWLTNATEVPWRDVMLLERRSGKF